MLGNPSRRAAIVIQARAIIETAKREGREPTADELAREAALWGELDRMEWGGKLPFDRAESVWVSE